MVLSYHNDCLFKRLEQILMETTHQPSGAPHILLTSLGTRVFKDTIYEWKGAQATADLAPLALMELSDKLGLPIPDRFVAVVTKDAETTTWPAFRDWVAKNRKIKPESISIDDGRDSNEIRKILESVADPKYIPEGAELTLDVTQGFRHFPFIFYALVLYLKSLRNVKIRGVYYGMAEGIPPADPKPIIDLQPLLELPEWFYAVRMFRDQGTTLPMANMLQPLADKLNDERGQLFRAGDAEAGRKLAAQANEVRNSVDWLQRYAFAYESALPLELGKASKGLIDSIRKPLAVDNVGIPPLFAELTEGVTIAAGNSAFSKFPRGGGNWKENLCLDAAELERQARMIDIYLGRDQLSLGVGLMREWVVSWAIWKSGKAEECEKWLNNKVRGRYERILGAIGDSAKNKSFRFTMTPVQAEFRDFWNRLTGNLRNALHHHAMRPGALEQVPNSLKDVQEFWNRLKTEGLKTKDGIALPPLGGRILISPQGRRPGVLFSALKVADPDTCLVICSDISVESTHDAAREAGFKGHIEQIKLEDPLGGFAEIDAIAENAQGYLSYAGKIMANITGGSTLMGVIVQRLVEEAQRLDRPVKRFALIDRRPQEEQDSDPFKVGESHWLDV